MRRPPRSTLFPYATLFRSKSTRLNSSHTIISYLLLGVQTCALPDRKSTRLNFSHTIISYAVFCLKKYCPRSELTPPAGGRGAAPSSSEPGLLGGAKPIPADTNFFFFNDTATTEIYTLSLHDALPI